MPLWAEFVDFVYAALFCLSTAFGGSMGLAIVVLSFAVRLALLPITLRLAYRALEMQAALEKIRPKLERISERYNLFLSRMAAGVSLYTLASGVVGLGQAMLVRRRAARLMAA